MRKKIDYLRLIFVYDLQDEFNLYCIKHKDLSLKRNAYNFARSQSCIRTGRSTGLEAYNIAKSIDTSQIGDVVFGEPNL